MMKILKLTFLIIFTISCFLIITSKAENTNAAMSYPFNGILQADASVIHNAPNTSSSSEVTQLVYGSRVKVTGEVGSMYKIIYDDNKEGYVAKSLVLNIDANTLTSNVSGLETYKDYCNNLVSSGFHESYCPYLYFIHSQYPNWQFRADVIDQSLSELSAGEEKYNVLQTTNVNYFLNPNLNPIEGDYYYVNRTVISSFMDPRNSLFLNKMFQFLDLKSSKDIYNDKALKKVSGSGNLSNYIKDFKDAASTYKVNAVHLIARSAQEGANKKTYNAVTGTYTTDNNKYSIQGFSLDGYYNFYNIGAYQSSSYSPVQRGLVYGAGFLENDNCFSKDQNGKAYYDDSKCAPLPFLRPWNSQAKAINGGASFLYTRYIDNGQDTLFYEKFNVSSYSKNGLYKNQYMTNINAPAAEATTIYNAYNTGNLLNSDFVFIIPVYQNMPDDEFQAVDKNSNSSLSSIKINDEAISGFDRDVIEYSHNLISLEDSFNVKATPTDSKASISGDGTYTFVNGVATINIVVTAEDGSKTTYTINVKKVIPEENITINDIISKIDARVNDNYIYGISPGTLTSTLINTINNNKGKATIVNANNQSKTTGNLATGDKITIKGTVETKTYIIAIRGDVNGDSEVNLADFVLIQSHILKRNTLSAEKFYAADVNYDNAIVLSDFVLVQSHILKKSSL